MEVGEALYRELVASTNGLNALIGTRCYPGIAPQGTTTPFVTYNRISEPIEHAMSVDPNIRLPRVQVNYFSTSFSQTRSMALQGMNAIRNFSTQQGLLGDATSGLKCQRCFFEFEQDIQHRDPETYEEIYHTIQDYTLWYSSS